MISGIDFQLLRRLFKFCHTLQPKHDATMHVHVENIQTQTRYEINIDTTQQLIIRILCQFPLGVSCLPVTSHAEVATRAGRKRERDPERKSGIS